MVKVVAVTGGKGGTGKTVVAASLARLLSDAGARTLLVDLDVENPCSYTLLGAELGSAEEVALFSPVIVEEKCTLCGACASACPAHALVLIPGKRLLFLEPLCESCATCLYACPAGAVARGRKVVGWVKKGRAGGVDLVVGELKPGSRQHHEVMERTLDYASSTWNGYDVAVLDLPPGSGKGIRSALKRADLALLVAEPTRLSLADTRRVHSLAREAGVREVLVLNKYGLPGGVDSEIEAFAASEGLALVKVRYDSALAEAYARGELVVGSKAPSAADLAELAKTVAQLLGLR
ncbi:nucleotide-binding protein [Thermofilum pendens]|uniref:Cobyrinic acid a,c-diamide synthase n=1 Tax=Thermofilum pendens (strain DSM 2475 / Hrk 5) TaxID=368408 RepID=A1RYW7_THEPD|nr:P-loop NTPase [Thermofilum pendens]ABL78397.1 Cobyrinic acid a,c-diamide synthase [Thermofilum pendens Hrk 5]